MGKAINFTLKLGILSTLILLLFGQMAYAQVGSISGTISQKENKPLIGHRVEVYNQNHYFSQHTNTQGGFSFKNIPPGLYNIVVWTPTGKLLNETVPLKTITITADNPKQTVNIEVSITIEPKNNPSPLVMEKAGSVRGSIVDTKGRKLEDYKVILRDENKGYTKEDHTDGYGRFEFINLPLGGYFLDVICLNGKIARKDIASNIFADSPNYRIEITVPENTCKNIEVPENLDAGNVEIQLEFGVEKQEAYTIELRNEDGLKISKWTDSLGYALFTEVPFGSYRVWVYSPNSEMITNTENVVLSVYTPFDSLSIKMSLPTTPNNGEGNGRVDAVLLNREDHARYLVVLTDGNQPQFHKWTGASGAVSFEQIPFGTYQMEVYSEDQKQLKNGINVNISTLFPAFSTEVDIESNSAKPNQLTTQVIYQGKPAADAIIRIISNGNLAGEKTTDKNGQAVFDNLKKATYSIQILDPREKKVRDEKSIAITPNGQNTITFDISNLSLSSSDNGVSNNNPWNTIPEKIDITLKFFSDACITPLSGQYVLELDSDKDDYKESFTNGTLDLKVTPGLYRFIIRNETNGVIFNQPQNIDKSDAGTDFSICNINLDEEDQNTSTTSGKGLFEGVVKSEGDKKEIYRLELVKIDDNETKLGWCDDRGNFSFKNLPMGTYEFRIYSSQTQRLLSKNTTFTLSMLFPKVYREIKLGGGASKKNKGIVEGSVTMVNAVKNLYHIKLFNEKDEFYRWTNPDGTFRFDGIPFGTYEVNIFSFPQNDLLFDDINVTLSHIIPLVTRQIELPENHKPISINTEKEEKEKGTVDIQVIKKDAPNKQYYVVLVDEGPIFKGYTGPDGHVLFKDVPYGSYTVQVFDAVTQKLLKHDDALNFSGLFDPHRMKIELKKDDPKPQKGKLDIQVVSKNSKNKKYRVVLYAAVDGKKTNFDSYSDINGNIQFDGIPVGSYQIYVFSESNSLLSQKTIVTLSDLFPKTFVKVEIEEPGSGEKPKKKGNIQVKVKQKGCQNCIFYVILFDAVKGSATEFKNWTDQSGYILFDSVPVGSYQVHVYSQKNKLLNQETLVTISELFPQKIIDIEIATAQAQAPDNKKKGSIRVTVDDKNGLKPTYHVVLFDVVNGKKTKFDDWTNNDGYIVFTSVPYGAYNAHIYTPQDQLLKKDEIVSVSELSPIAYLKVAIEKDKSPKPKCVGAFEGQITGGKDGVIYRIKLVGDGKPSYRWSNNAGYFYFDNIKCGDYTFTVYTSPAENLIYESNVTISELFDKPHREIKLKQDPPKSKPGIIWGKIKDDNNKDALYHVALVANGEHKKMYPTQKDGVFRMDGLNFGTFELHLYKDSGGNPSKLLKSDISVTISQYMPIAYREINLTDPKKKAKTKGSLNGRIFKEGQTVNHYKIILTSGEKTLVKETNDVGAFEITDIPLGNYKVEIYTPNQKLVKDDIGWIEFNSNFATYDLGEIKLKKAKEETQGTITGKVTYLKTSKNSPAAKIVLRDGNGSVIKSTTSGDDGRFTFEKLKLETYWLRAYSLEPGKEGSELKELKDNKEKPIEIKCTLSGLFPDRFVEVKVGKEPQAQNQQIKFWIYNAFNDTLQYRVELHSVKSGKIKREWFRNNESKDFTSLNLNETYRIKVFDSEGNQVTPDNPECLTIEELTDRFPGVYVHLTYRAKQEQDKKESDGGWSRAYDVNKDEKKKEKKKDALWRCKQWPIGN